MTKVILIFKTPDRAKHSTQTFTVASWEVHTFKFLKLVFSDGSLQFYNLVDLFSFQIVPVVE